ncbi:MAG: hypothetical protein ACLUE8_13795 [Lachnospiraceae bacterium]
MTEKNTQTQGDRTDPERIIAALRELRSPFALYEQDIHQAVTRRLTEAGLPFTHEKNLAPGCRIDFWCGGVGIEIKKASQNPPHCWNSCDGTQSRRKLARWWC